MPHYYSHAWTIASDLSTDAGQAYIRKFYEAVMARCEIMRMPASKLESTAGLPSKTIQLYGEGTRCPTTRRVQEISQALGQDFCAAFPVIFTGDPVDEAALSEPSTVGSRFQHLINLLTHGVLVRFAIITRINDKNLRQTIARHEWPKNNPDELLRSALPTLSLEWLRRGEGPVFTDGQVPAIYSYEPPRPKAPVPMPRAEVRRPAAPARAVFSPPPPAATWPGWSRPPIASSTATLPAEATMMLTEAYPDWQVLGGYDLGQLASPTPALLQSLSERLRRLAKRGASLTSKQIMELASFLDLVQPEVFFNEAASLPAFHDEPVHIDQVLRTAYPTAY